MSKLRSVNTHFWNDNYIIDLDPIEKLLFLYLLTNPNTNMLGVYELHIRKISFDTGIDKDMVQKIFDRFHEAGKASYVDGYVCLHNFLSHQKMNDNMKKSAITTFKELPDKIKKSNAMRPVITELSNIDSEITNFVIEISRPQALFVKYRGVCQYCEEEIDNNENIEIDHVDPLSKGGPDTYDNLVLSCRKCNQKKLDKTPEEMGWDRPSTGYYHFNTARKSLSELTWLRKRFNTVFKRKLRIEDGELVDVNHKHTLNKPFQPIAEIEYEYERELEEETEIETEPEKELYTVDSYFEFSENYNIDYKSFIDFFNEVTGGQCRMTPNKKPDIKKQLKTFTGTEIKQALINRSKALKDSEYLTSWESIFTRKPERMEKYLNLKTSNLNRNGQSKGSKRAQQLRDIQEGWPE